MSVDSHSKEYDIVFPQWQEVRAAIGGRPTVIALLVKRSLLPSPLYAYRKWSYKDDDGQEHSTDNYALNTKRKESYWARARFFNATGRTHESLDGMLWSKDPEIELPESLNYLQETGKLRNVVQDVSGGVTAIGRGGVFVDMPESTGTIAEQENNNQLPRLVYYKAEQIKYWRFDGEKLLEVRLWETYEEQKSEFEFEEMVRIRRLVIKGGLFFVELYKKGEDKPYQVFEPTANNERLREITFQFFGAENNDPNVGKVTLYDLASCNLGHFVLDADNRDNLHYHGQGMTNVFTEMDDHEFNLANPNGLDTGAKGSNQFRQQDKVELLQLEATGAIPSEMERDQKRMVALGAQVVQDVNTNVTLGAKEMEFSSSTSTLKRISRNISVGMKNCLQWVLDYLGQSGEITFTLNMDFITDDMTAQDVLAHFQLVQQGYLPEESLFETSRKAGYTDKDDEALREAIQEQGINGVSEEVAALMARIEALEAANNGGES